MCRNKFRKSGHDKIYNPKLLIIPERKANYLQKDDIINS